MNYWGFFYLLCCSQIVLAQNVLNTSSWGVGTEGFAINGNAAENSFEWGTDHLGNYDYLWKASPDGNNDADGGWNSNYHAIDAAQTYRFSVWIKKTNSISGTTYFGCDEPSSLLYTLDDVPNANPYFWSGDLPRLDRWYLLVGYVNGYENTETVNLGGIYDGGTAELVLSITDYKMASGATALRHSAFLSYDTNTEDRQYFYAPRIEPLNGLAPSIEELLGVHPESTLSFMYDLAGNQTDLNYRIAPVQSEDTVLLETTLATRFEDIYIYPNPTSGVVLLEWETVVADYISEVTLTYLVNQNTVPLNYTLQESSIEMDMSGLSTGIYAVKIQFIDGSELTEEIIKI